MSTGGNMTDTQKIALLRQWLGVILDQVDYTAGACVLTEMVGAVLDPDIFEKARKALEDTKPEATSQAEAPEDAEGLRRAADDLAAFLFTWLKDSFNGATLVVTPNIYMRGYASIRVDRLAHSLLLRARTSQAEAQAPARTDGRSPARVCEGCKGRKTVWLPAAGERPCKSCGGTGCLPDRRALLPTTAEAQAPTTAASVLTEDASQERIAKIVACMGCIRSTGYDAGIDVTTLYQAAAAIDRLTSTVGAPAPASIPEHVKKAAAFQRARTDALAADPDETAPAPTMPTREQIDECVRTTLIDGLVIADCGCDAFYVGNNPEFVDALVKDLVPSILALIAKGDTP